MHSTCAMYVGGSGQISARTGVKHPDALAGTTRRLEAPIHRRQKGRLVCVSTKLATQLKGEGAEVCIRSQISRVLLPEEAVGRELGEHGRRDQALWAQRESSSAKSTALPHSLGVRAGGAKAHGSRNLRLSQALSRQA